MDKVSTEQITIPLATHLFLVNELARLTSAQSKLRQKVQKLSELLRQQSNPQKKASTRAKANTTAPALGSWRKASTQPSDPPMLGDRSPTSSAASQPKINSTSTDQSSIATSESDRLPTSSTARQFKIHVTSIDQSIIAASESKSPTPEGQHLLPNANPDTTAKMDATAPTVPSSFPSASNLSTEPPLAAPTPTQSSYLQNLFASKLGASKTGPYSSQSIGVPITNAVGSSVSSKTIASYKPLDKFSPLEIEQNLDRFNESQLREICKLRGLEKTGKIIKLKSRILQSLNG
eukprot:TRINITY_DN1933_c0_g1_i2.p2 TRINITY_DN1933_c0_g1~~TRINITY_DN1933_c0_g1_i2.p2  ORF type:complete len:291 (-),score=62.20 TRINITY_DN1933_c0_g1_i2:1111-1983(-)